MEIVVDKKNKTLKAVLTDPEFSIVSRVIEAQGKEAVADVFAGFIQQRSTEQRVQDQEMIKQFTETSTDEDRAALVEVIRTRRAA